MAVAARTSLGIFTDPFSFTTIGAAGGGERLSGLDYQPGTNTLFASSGFGGPNPGSLFTVDADTGMATLVGTGTGFDSVPGIAFNNSGTLFGSAADASFGDTLITIDPVSGAGTVVGSFGGGFEGIDGIAFDPTSDTLYGIGGPGFDQLFTIDTTTGAATLLGSLTEAGTGDPLPGADFFAGLTFDASGNLFASLGAGNGEIAGIDIANLEFTLLGDATPGGGSVSDIAISRAGAAVPEPASIALWSLIGLGVAGFGVYRVRRMK